MKEVWITCADPDAQNYEVSNFGEVRNATTERILRPQLDRNGYLTVTLSNYGVQHTKYVHVLVANTFLNPDTYLGEEAYRVVSFRDGDRTNVYADNLEYISRSESIQRSFQRGRKQTHCCRRVRCVETGEEFASIVESSRVTGISVQAISRCINQNMRCTRSGLHFESIDEE